MITNETYMRTDMKQKKGIPTTQDVLTHHLNSFGDVAGTMRLTHFFIERPRFATVLSTFITLLGAGALRGAAG